MSDTRLEQTQSQNPLNIGTTQQEGLRIEEKSEPTSVVTPVPTAELEAKIPAPQRSLNRTGTIEHLASRSYPSSMLGRSNNGYLCWFPLY